MSKIKLVMIEDNKDLCDIAISRISSYRNGLFDIIGVAHDGKNGCKLVFEKMPDVVLIDIVLPIHSGLSVLKQIKQNPLTKHIICIIVSSVNSEAILSHALELGADYYVIKPFDFDSLIDRMVYLHTFMSSKSVSFTAKNDENDIISNLSAEDFALYALQSAGVPMNLNGYTYLKSAIVMCIFDGQLLDAVTKELYTKIGAEYQTTASRVERCIRNAIECTWAAGLGKQYYDLIGDYTLDDDFAKPTNSAFIFSIVALYHKYHRNN